MHTMDSIERVDLEVTPVPFDDEENFRAFSRGVRSSTPIRSRHDPVELDELEGKGSLSDVGKLDLSLAGHADGEGIEPTEHDLSVISGILDQTLDDFEELALTLGKKSSDDDIIQMIEIGAFDSLNCTLNSVIGVETSTGDERSPQGESKKEDESSDTINGDDGSTSNLLELEDNERIPVRDTSGNTSVISKKTLSSTGLRPMALEPTDENHHFKSFCLSFTVCSLIIPLLYRFNHVLLSISPSESYVIAASATIIIALLCSLVVVEKP